jgi:polyhydroxyalkanoate synthase subunit PhaC
MTEATNPWVQMPQLDQQALASVQANFLKQWQQISEAAVTGALPPVSDRRFRGEAWAQSPAHLLMAHLYLLSSDSVKRLVDATQVSDELKEQLRFSVSQWIDAMSPANFLATNPDAQKALIESGGQTLQTGIANLISDMQKGRITHSDETKFEVGRDLAITPGCVVFKNKYFELLQYGATTKTVFQRPLLMVPPCINKYYIFDLQPENSLVRYLVEQGFTVFVVSWRNPLPEDKDGIDTATWDDYLEHGVIKGIDVVREISGQTKINALGFCVGGTMLTSALAVLAARKKSSVASLTLLATMLDFVDTGALGLFATQAHAKLREQAIGKRGLMTARELANTFSFLRPNELVWNYVVSNYLKGETPVPFDLLYWNGDSTNLPGPLFVSYFRRAYIENKLCRPGQTKVCGEKIDFSTVDVPAYLMASKEDHIVPWQTAYHSAQILGGPIRFVLGASGHIAGVINPASKNKRNYWVSEKQTTLAPDDWFLSATEKPGSWWPDYTDWLKGFAGKRVAARAKLGSAEHPVLEAAPGSYVKVRAV